MSQEPDPIRPLAFIVALVAAPLSTALPGLAMLLLIGMTETNAGPFLVIGYFLVGAVLVGGIPYLAVGVPGLLHALRRHGRHAPTGQYAFLGHVLSIPVVLLIFLFIEGGDPFGFIIFYLVMGSLFAPLWGTLFLIFYNCILDRGQAAHV